jgi:dTDP-glucose 4,6-dehydratase
MIVVTGGSGFIGSNFILDWFDRFDEELVNIDIMTYAANNNNLGDINKKDIYNFIQEDIGNYEEIFSILKKYKPRAIFNFAAESYVDKSIEGPDVFIKTNINGTYNLLKASSDYWLSLTVDEKSSFRFIHISTDEVYGSLSFSEPAFTEKNQYLPNSPYSASKASSDHLVRCFNHTYYLPTLITNCSNNYGPHQHHEKLIPKIIKNALELNEIPIFGKGQQIRDWLYVKDHVSAIITVFEKGIIGETYNIGGGNEKNNVEVVNHVCGLLDALSPIESKKIKNYSQLIRFVADRPGHDFRYAIDSSKIKKQLKWLPKENFESGIKKTIKWYLKNNY